MSTIKVDNLQTTGGAGLYPARAWCSFNGIGSVYIRNDGNVSSITDNGVGDYTASFSNTLSTSNYGLSVGNAAYTPSDPGGSDTHLYNASGTYGANPLLSTSSIRMEHGFNSGANYDNGFVSFLIIT